MVTPRALSVLALVLVGVGRRSFHTSLIVIKNFVSKAKRKEKKGTWARVVVSRALFIPVLVGVHRRCCNFGTSLIVKKSLVK